MVLENGVADGDGGGGHGRGEMDRVQNWRGDLDGRTRQDLFQLAVKWSLWSQRSPVGLGLNEAVLLHCA